GVACGSARTKMLREGKRQRVDGFPLRRELVVEQSPPAEMRIGERVLYGSDHVAAQVLARENGAPFVRRFLDNARRYGPDRGRGIGGVAARGGRQTYRVAEGLPEPLFEGRCGDEAALACAVDVVAGAAAGDERLARRGPHTRDEPVAHRPVHKREQVVG